MSGDDIPLCVTLDWWIEYESREHAKILANVEGMIADLDQADADAIRAEVRRQLNHYAEINHARIVKILSWRSRPRCTDEPS